MRRAHKRTDIQMAAFNGLCPQKFPYSKATLWSEWGSLLPVFWQCYLETGKEMPKRNIKRTKNVTKNAPGSVKMESENNSLSFGLALK